MEGQNQVKQTHLPSSNWTEIEGEPWTLKRRTRECTYGVYALALGLSRWESGTKKYFQ